MKYGWKPDLADFRDHRYSVSNPASLPEIVDLRGTMCPPIYDQGNLGSCTANAIGAALEFDLMKKLLPVITPSRLFIYYNERALEGSIQYDSGAQIRDGIKTLNVQGFCDEMLWPYLISIFTETPSQEAYIDGLKHKVVDYQRLQGMTSYKSCLAAGYPVIFGFTVYESFESPTLAKSGIMNMPLETESVLGGHAVCLVGYNDISKVFICRNSWGNQWGDEGYFYMPYSYFDAGLTDDFWTVKVTS